MGLKFVILAQNNANVLARVVMLFHRYGVEIEAIRMPARRKRKELQITIFVDGHQAHAHRMDASLYKLVDVLAVEIISGGPSSIRKRRH